eukprot:CAMPEP_0172660632 /NCGR_PEP_ID=MMETSP1074-20121228/4173_1 /TAXON_ID=2916 /ORGANISM="Ceratium fusus, Strain PA161109" /LENGTH=123 /DNA_ID=CAMNT_0013476267 /DNA_START=38 /DNA_END=409 /DNA_ORIENTATION=+
MPELVMLVAGETSEKVQATFGKIKQILKKFNVVEPSKEIDGTLKENKELRSTLFELSGQTGVYPQLFRLDEDGTYTFLATGSQIEGMNEVHECVQEMLKQDPDFLKKNDQYQLITDVFKDFIN